MNQNIVAQLLNASARAAQDFSREDRPLNTNRETFAVHQIIPQETTAWVLFKKSSGKLAAAFFYYVNTRGGEWRYWFVRSSDAIGMIKVHEVLCGVEEHNFPLNYNVDVIEVRG